MKTTTVEVKAAVMRSENDYIDSGDRHESSDVIFAFIDDEDEVERPATTRSGRAITRRSEIEFSFFFSTNSERAVTFLFC